MRLEAELQFRVEGLGFSFGVRATYHMQTWYC
jgi:hypothetical protein